MSPRPLTVRIAVPAPNATSVTLFLRSCRGPEHEEWRVEARRDAGMWVAEAQAERGDHYWISVDGGPPLLDPSCRDLEWTPDGPRSVVREGWPVFPPAPALVSPPVVYEHSA